VALEQGSGQQTSIPRAELQACSVGRISWARSCYQDEEPRTIAKRRFISTFLTV
jgi:hypothetical protein